jgi:hypothetical protein
MTSGRRRGVRRPFDPADADMRASLRSGLGRRSYSPFGATFATFASFASIGLSIVIPALPARSRKRPALAPRAA